MTTRDKDKINVLINEAKVWADSHTEKVYGTEYGEEKVFQFLETHQVKMLLDQLKEKLLKDDDISENKNHLRECPCCHSHKVEPHVNPGSWGYYPASAYIECNDCGTRSKDYDGKDDCDQEGAILKATLAWNRRI